MYSDHKTQILPFYQHSLISVVNVGQRVYKGYMHSDQEILGAMHIHGNKINYVFS